MIEIYDLNSHKMTTPQEKAQCLSWFIEIKSDVQTQRNYRSRYGRDQKQRISNALATIDEAIIQRTWQEFDY